MRVRDLFAGCSVTIMAVGGRWAVGLADDNATSLAVTTYGSVEDALQASRQWLGLLDNESQVLDTAALRQPELAMTVREAVVQALDSHEPVEQTVLHALGERFKLRSWFHKQLEP